jgi:hypothetical protein
MDPESRGCLGEIPGSRHGAPRNDDRWLLAFAGTTKESVNARFSEHSACRSETSFVTHDLPTRECVMERRHFLKLTVGFVAGATALAASAQAAPLPPVSALPSLKPPHREGAEPAVVSQHDVDHLKPEGVRWGPHWHWHHRHWGWHRRHW